MSWTGRIQKNVQILRLYLDANPDSCDGETYPQPHCTYEDGNNESLLTKLGIDTTLDMTDISRVGYSLAGLVPTKPSVSPIAST